MGALPVPVVTVVTGEGCSGGALAIAVADRVLIMENAVYTVISPEGCAAILWRDSAAAPAAARALRHRRPLAARARRGRRRGARTAGGAESDHAEAAALVRAAIRAELADLAAPRPGPAGRQRRARFRRFGSRARPSTSTAGADGDRCEDPSDVTAVTARRRSRPGRPARRGARRGPPQRPVAARRPGQPAARCCGSGPATWSSRWSGRTARRPRPARRRPRPPRTRDGAAAAGRRAAAAADAGWHRGLRADRRHVLPRAGAGCGAVRRPRATRSGAGSRSASSRR